MVLQQRLIDQQRRSPMQTQCSADLFGFAPVDRRPVQAAFDGGAITSDAGGLLLGATDRAIRLVERFATCFRDHRRPELVEHSVETLVGQRIFGIVLGYEDLNDHDVLRHDPVMALLAGKLEARRPDCAPMAGKSTLNRLELSRSTPSRYHKITHDPRAIERLFVDLFLEAQPRPPAQIIITTATASCRSTSTVAATGWLPCSGDPTRTRRRVRSRKSRASSARSAGAGRGPAFCCAAIPVSPAKG